MWSSKKLTPIIQNMSSVGCGKRPASFKEESGYGIVTVGISKWSRNTNMILLQRYLKTYRLSQALVSDKDSGSASRDKIL